MSAVLSDAIQRYREDYLEAEEGQKHLAIAEAEIKEVQRVFTDIWNKHQTDQDITDDVLQRLLPHLDTEYHREHDHRISTWPAIRRDVRKWFENAGWKEPHEWPETARLLLEGINGLVNGNMAAWERFVNSPLRHGFGTGFVSPIVFCLDQEYVVINSKVVKTYRWCASELGSPDEINAKLPDYLNNSQKVHHLRQQLASLGLTTYLEWDIFCHYAISKKLGGGNLTQERKTAPVHYPAWLFVANPSIFHWKQAFPDKGVEWTGSKSPYAQKMIREHMREGDLVFGYQAGPVYKVLCELTVTGSPYQTAEGTWAVRLKPVRWFPKPISLPTLQSHPLLSKLKFIQQTQMSISGVNESQLQVLRELTETRSAQKAIELSPVEELCQRLLQAQYNTTNYDRFEAALTDAFSFLGFEAEHIGGSGDADALVTAELGSDSYSVVVDAKTRSKNAPVGQLNYQPINDHREEHGAEYAVVIAHAFAGGNVITHAEIARVGLLTTKQLVTVIRLHDRFPFHLTELRGLFEGSGLAAGVEGRFERIHRRHDDYLQLVERVVTKIDALQRRQENSSPVDSNALYYVLLSESNYTSAPAPKRDEIDDVLSFLSNPVLNALIKEDNGYILTLPPSAVQRRIQALATVLFSGQEDTEVQ